MSDTGSDSELQRRRWLLAHLRSAVEHLAWPAENQLEYLRDLGVDELALELDDVREAAIGAGLLTQPQEPLLRSLDELLDSMSGKENAALWTGEALRTGKEWVEVRRRAQATLRSLDDGPAAAV